MNTLIVYLNGERYLACPFYLLFPFNLRKTIAKVP